MLVPSLCSLAAGSWVLLTFWRFPKLRTPTMMLVLVETCSEMLFIYLDKRPMKNKNGDKGRLFNDGHHMDRYGVVMTMNC
jgi:hypothetical protein